MLPSVPFARLETLLTCRHALLKHVVHIRARSLRAPAQANQTRKWPIIHELVREDGVTLPQEESGKRSLAKK